MKLLFGDIVVVEDELVGVIVRTWANDTVDVFVRMYNSINEYPASDVERYGVRHKYLNEEERAYQEEYASLVTEPQKRPVSPKARGEELLNLLDEHKAREDESNY